MKLLPICINGRTDHMIDFEAENTIEDSFVITSDTEGVLLSLHHYKPINGGSGPAAARKAGAVTGIMLQTETGPTCISISSIEADTKEEEDVVLIKLTQDSTTVNNTLDDSIYNFDKDAFKISHTSIKKARSIKVIFEYASYQQCIRIYLAPQSQIRDVVLDCGSEATQMAMFHHNEPCSINDRIRILKDIFTHFGKKERACNYTDFVQAESEVKGLDCNKYLFKSVFFAKDTFESDEIKEDKVYPMTSEVEDENSILRMCTTLEDMEKIRDSHIQLYNMKISSFGGIELPYVEWDELEVPIGKIPNNFFYRKYMNQFIYQALKHFCHASNQPDEEENCARVLSLHILVPNVYTPKKTHEFITTIQKDTQRIIEMNEAFKQKVLGVCVTAVSESDASLIGAISLQDHHEFKAGTYLVMDAGKGTLDFSITRYEDNGTFKNIMKGGFVGAAAAINYGFMLDLLQEYLISNGICTEVSSENLREFIFENILGKTKNGQGLEGGDLCQLSNLMQAVDEYKIRYSNLSEYSKISANSTDSKINEVKLSSFVEWIKNRNTKIQLDYVDSVIDTIINYVYSKITGYANCKIDNVIFAGRGFLFTRFKEQMFNMLQRIYPKISEKTFLKQHDATNNKIICLFITNAIGEGRYNSQLLPIPYEVDKELVDELLNISYNDSSNDKPKEDTTTNLLDKLRQIIESKTELSIPVNQKVEETKTGDNPFVVGYKIQTAQNINIVIGGTFYQLGIDVPVDQNARLFYNKGNIIIRNSNNQIHQLIEPINLGTGLSFPSLFPFCQVTRYSDIYIPNKVTLPNETSTQKKKESSKHVSQKRNDSDKEKSALDKLAEFKND